MMRTFSAFEKGIITRLTETELVDSNILNFISNSVLTDRGIKIIENEKTLSLIYKANDVNAPTQLFEIIFLLKYLESNYLLFKHTNIITKYKGNFVTKNLTEQTLLAQEDEFRQFPIPTNIFDIIQDYKTSYMVVGTELKNLVQNNFKTSEDIKHQNEMKIARVSLFIALLALLFSFLSPFIFDTKIDEKQIDKILNEIKGNDKEIIVKPSDSIINQRRANSVEDMNKPTEKRIDTTK